jgi:hypothetical protein
MSAGAAGVLGLLRFNEGIQEDLIRLVIRMDIWPVFL